MPHPTTYLNGELWEDEIIPPREKTNGKIIPRDCDEMAAWALREGYPTAPAGMSSPDYRQLLITEQRNRQAP